MSENLMKISAESYGIKHTVELPEDASIDDVVDAFKRLAVCLTFPVSLVDDAFENSVRLVEKPYPDEQNQNRFGL